MKILTWILLMHLLYPATSGQNNIEFFPKELGRELKKTCNTDLQNYSEIYIPESIQPFPGLNGKFYKASGNDCAIMFMYIGRVYSCRADGCTAPTRIMDPVNREYFDYFILFDSSIKVKLVRIYNYQASHGQEVTAKGWLKQFIDYDGSELVEVGKNIDAISGATVSALGITYDIQAKSEILRKINHLNYQ